MFIVWWISISCSNLSIAKTNRHAQTGRQQGKQANKQTTDLNGSFKTLRKNNPKKHVAVWFSRLWRCYKCKALEWSPGQPSATLSNRVRYIDLGTSAQALWPLWCLRCTLTLTKIVRGTVDVKGYEMQWNAYNSRFCELLYRHITNVWYIFEIFQNIHVHSGCVEQHPSRQNIMKYPVMKISALWKKTSNINQSQLPRNFRHSFPNRCCQTACESHCQLCDLSERKVSRFWITALERSRKCDQPTVTLCSQLLCS